MTRKKLGPRPAQALRPGAETETQIEKLVQETAGFFAIPLSSLRLDTVTGFDLYLRSPRDRKHVLYRSGELKFTEDHRSKLQQSSVTKVFISSADRSKYMRYLETNLSQILADDTIPSPEKSKILYGSATQLVQDVFARPTLGENIKRAQDLVESTVSHLMKGGEHLGSMLGIMSFDYQTYTHSVNVCVFGVALGRRIGLSGMELNELGTGLLLHDVGKSTIDPAILLKQGPLTDAEWVIVKTHPDEGVRMLSESGRVSKFALAVVHQHHEKCSGAGYPQGIKEPQIHLYAKIAALADVFDALTTKRCYKQAVDSFPAIRIMQNEMAESFNDELLRELILMMNAAEITSDRERVA
jgi:HD-GYP domain-containing protein (c-di-GMP phosphodiesterase class II)